MCWPLPRMDRPFLKWEEKVLSENLGLHFVEAWYCPCSLFLVAWMIFSPPDKKLNTPFSHSWTKQ